MKHYGDVSKIEGSQVEPVDIITFGSPCQDLSVAGKRAGIQDGERSNLFFEAVRIIKEMRDATNGEYPKYAVWENVPGAFSSNKGHDFHAVLEALCSVCDSTVSIPRPSDPKRPDNLVWDKAGEIVGDNYSVAWRTLDAQYWGVPQRRKRIYLVADFTGIRAGEILFKPDSLRWDMQEGDEAREGVTADVVGGVDGSVGVECLAVDGYNQTVSDICGSIRAGKADQDHVGCTVYSFDSLSSNSMKSSNPFSGCRAVEIAKCIDTTYPDPSKNQGGVAVVECYDARGNGDVETACTITGDHQNRITDYTAVACFQNTGRGWWNESETAATVRTPSGSDAVNVNFAVSIGNGQLNQISMAEQSTALDCMHDKQAVLTGAKPPRKYIIRRLTPAECARLQGFPDSWGHLAPYDPADAEFWEDVRKTHAEINGKKYKPTKNLKKWYEGLHTDSAEYKMWGNGIALPNARYVIQGIAEHGAKTLGSLFDGSGGFPLAGMLNGIEPIWASEVEPFPIAVTVSRFGRANET